MFPLTKALLFNVCSHFCRDKSDAVPVEGWFGFRRTITFHLLKVILDVGRIWAVFVKEKLERVLKQTCCLSQEQALDDSSLARSTSLRTQGFDYCENQRMLVKIHSGLR